MKLSIVIPVYNTRDYLAACLDSVLEAGGDYEILIINDGSTDDPPEIAAATRRASPSSSAPSPTANGGLAAARNVGLENARGDYLLFVDSDDTLEKGALPEILAALDGSFDIGIFDISQVNPAGELVERMTGCPKGGDFDPPRLHHEQRQRRPQPGDHRRGGGYSQLL